MPDRAEQGTSDATTSPTSSKGEPSKREPKSKGSEAASGKEKSKQVPSGGLYAAALSALLGAYGMGIVIGWSSPSFLSLENGDAGLEIKDKVQHSWIGSSMTLGALVGALVSAWVGQQFGRKLALVFYGVPFTVGWMCIGFAQSYEMLLIARVVLGLNTGLASGTAPVYVKEISTIGTQGTLGTGFQMFVILGVMTSFSLGLFLNWKVLGIVSAIPTIAMSILMLGMPETPSWLLAHNRREDAQASLKRLRGEGNASDKELDDLEAEHKSEAKFSLEALVAAYQTYGHFMPCVLAVLLQVLQQISGINAVTFYIASIFKESKVPLDPNVASLMLAWVQLPITLVLGYLLTRLGRKPMLYFWAAVQVVSLASLGAYYYATKDSTEHSLRFIPVVCLVAYILGFAFGWGPIPWLMIPELTPLMSRSATAAIATATNWGSAFLVSKFFVNLVDLIDKHGAFFLFSFCCLVSIFFIFFMLPETKDKKPGEIALSFKRGKASRGQESSQPSSTPGTPSTELN